jgi:hypothetical protein
VTRDASPGSSICGIILIANAKRLLRSRAAASLCRRLAEGRRDRRRMRWNSGCYSLVPLSPWHRRFLELQFVVQPQGAMTSTNSATLACLAVLLGCASAPPKSRVLDSSPCAPRGVRQGGAEIVRFSRAANHAGKAAVLGYAGAARGWGTITWYVASSSASGAWENTMLGQSYGFTDMLVDLTPGLNAYEAWKDRNAICSRADSPGE